MKMVMICSIWASILAHTTWAVFCVGASFEIPQLARHPSKEYTKRDPNLDDYQHTSDE